MVLGGNFEKAKASPASPIASNLVPATTIASQHQLLLEEGARRPANR